MAARILAFAGSLRKDSYNKKLVKVAAEGARQAGAEVTYIDLADYPLPIYDQDLEDRDGLPQAAKDLKALFSKHQGLLIASPEYNSSISAALKNTIDWISRPVEGDPPLAEFAGKVAGLMAASPGMLGGLRGLVHIRAILGNIRVLVIPDQLAVPKAHEAFDDAGKLRDERTSTAIMDIGKRVAEVAASLSQ